MVNYSFQKNQSGAVLLAFMLILITGTSYLLVNKLNSNLIKVGAAEQTRLALNEAKQALIGYAVNYPESHPGDGPGYLVCPDRDNDGDTDSGGCSLSPTSTTSIGRYPYKTLETREFYDSHGEKLWYIVSNNFRNNPKMVPLNSETAGDPSGSLTINGVADVAAIIFAPGAPQDNQSRNLEPNNYSNYIEITISSDGKTITTSNTDNYILLTRDELLQAVEKRVLGEAKIFLTNYFSNPLAGNNNAYPWLTPFADPKADYHGIPGIHDGGDGANTLTDTSKNFSTSGAQNGDIVRNITDGSIAAVTGVAGNTLTLSTLTQGLDNDFDNDDQYIVYINTSGTASGSSSGLTLEDSSRDFEDIGVTPGDVIENITDGSSGVIDSVSGSQLTVSSLTSGEFNSGDVYQIRSNYGRATGGNNNTSLIDANKNFITMGVQVGDMVVNLSDNSLGRVSSVTNTTTLAIEQMYFGTDNDFDTNDYYYLPRYNTNNLTREGLLSFHENGKHFRTAFSIDWNATTANGATVNSTIAAASPNTDYQNNLRNRVQTSAGTLGTVNIDADNGQCVWQGEAVASCSGIYLDTNFPVLGTVTAGSNTSTLTDSNANFTFTAIKRGDIVENYDDESSTGISGTASAGTSSLILKDTGKNFNALGIIPYFHLIHDTSDSSIRGLITEIIDNNTLRVEGFSGRPPINLASGHNYTIYQPQRVVVDSVNSATQLNTVRISSAAADFDYNAGEGGAGGYQELYQIKVGTGKLSGTAKTGSSVTTLVDTAANFSDIEIGDIIENTTDDAFGIITAVSGNTLTAQTYTNDGSLRNFSPGEGYIIYYDHDVNTRRYEFKPLFAGSSNVYSSGDQRKRNVCLGYGTDCNSTVSNVTLSRQNSLVTIRDLDINGNEVGRASVNVPGSTTGSIKISGLDYYLWQATDEIPAWFVENNWHQLVYIAYSNDDTSAGAAVCTPGTNCLTLNGGGAPNADKRALVVIAGRELSSQSRSTGGLGEFYEGSNNNIGDNDTFQKAANSTAFNDQVRILSTAP